MEITNEIYPGGFYSLINSFEKKRQPFANAEQVLPQPDADLAPLFLRPVAASSVKTGRRRINCIIEQRGTLGAQLSGLTEAHLLNAILISVLRRDDPPTQALPLFLRLWHEHGKRLVADMPVRWMVSSATTFADCGQTPEQRACGMGLSVLFDVIKLYESERAYSGISGRRLFKRRKSAKSHSIAFGLTTYSFKAGDLDKNLLARLWRLSEADQTIQPLAQAMLRLAVTDTRTIFARTQKIKEIRAETRVADSE